jgi:hypothetical protein
MWQARERTESVKFFGGNTRGHTWRTRGRWYNGITMDLGILAGGMEWI